MVLNKKRGGMALMDSPPAPHPIAPAQWWLNGVNRRDRVLTPLSGQNLRPITFTVCSNCGSSVDSVVGETRKRRKGKVKKAKSNGSAPIHLTGRVNGNKWLSLDCLYIRHLNVTTGKDTRGYWKDAHSCLDKREAVGLLKIKSAAVFQVVNSKQCCVACRYDSCGC